MPEIKIDLDQSTVNAINSLYFFVDNPDKKLEDAIARLIEAERRLNRWEKDEEHCLYTMHGKNCRVSVMPRPHYCDRGDWYAVVDAPNPIALSVDTADGFPRYYFGLDVALEQCEKWLEKRGELVLKAG